MHFEKAFNETDEYRFLYASSYYVVKAVGKVALGLKITGAEHIPETGPAIIAANHRHWLDIFLGPIAIPNRHLTMIAKKEIYETPIMGDMFRKWGTISVDRENPSHETTREVLYRLRAARLVAVLPEGHRYQNQELGDMHAGVARWARLGQTATIPAAIRGVDSLPKALLHRSAEVKFGEPLEPPVSRNDEVGFMIQLRAAIQNLYDS